MKTATGNSVLRAYSLAAKRVRDPKLTSTTESAGFIIPKGEKQGWQVFVKLCKYDENLLKIKPETGGLFSEP